MKRKTLVDLGPLFLALTLSTMMVLQSYTSFGQGEAFLFRPLFAISIAFVGCVVSYLLSGGLPHMHKSLGREIVGAAALVLVLYGMMAVCLLTPLGKSLRPWEFAVIPACCFTFFLQSQRSFLIHLTIHSTILLVALIAVPFLPTAIGLLATSLLLFVLLTYREKREESPTGKHLNASVVIAGAPLPIIAILGLLGLFSLIKPPKPPERRGEEATAQAAPPIPGFEVTLPREAVRTPFVPQAAGEEHLTVHFDRDLKFGDRAEDAALEYAVVMLVQLRDQEGTLIRPGEMPRYWKVGVLNEYNGREWTGPKEAGKLVEDDDDTKKDGVVRFFVPKSGTQMFVHQRYIVSPMANKALPLIYPVASLTMPEAAMDEEETLFRTQLFRGRFKYEAISYPPFPSRNDLRMTAAHHPNRRYVDVPHSVANDPTFRAVYRMIASRAQKQMDVIDETIKHFSVFTYTLTPGLDKSKDPTLEFLKHRRGYCQHFASAFCLMLRYFGIPARIAVGFAGGDWDERERVYVVRRKHAHSWVEVHFDLVGWVPYDPTAMLQTESPMVAAQSPDDPVPPWMPGGLERSHPTPGREPARPPGHDPARTPSGDSTREPGRIPSESSREPGHEPGRTPERGPKRESGPGLPDAPDRTRPAEATTQFDHLWRTIENRAPDLTRQISPVEAVREPDPPKPREPVRPPPAPKELEYTAQVLMRDVVLGMLLLLLAIGALKLLVPRKKAVPGVPEELGETSEPAPSSQGVQDERSAILRGTPRHKLIQLYVEFLRRLADRGHARQPWQTPLEFAEASGLPGLMDLTGMFIRARYGFHETTPEELQTAKKAVSDILRNTRKA